MLSQRCRGKGVLQGCELGTCVSALQESEKERKRTHKNASVLILLCVCGCAKARKMASQTVISKTMCQLTEGTHAPLYSGLSSGPALCLFFLQWTGSSVYNSHPKPSMWNILPATAAKLAKAAWTFAKSSAAFCSICRISPYFLHMKKTGTFFFWKTKGVVNWFEAHVNSSTFMSQIPLRVTVFVQHSSSGQQRERPLFMSALQAKKENSLYPSTLCRLPYLQGIELGSRWKTGWGILGGVWWGLAFWTCSRVYRLHQ